MKPENGMKSGWKWMELTKCVIIRQKALTNNGARTVAVWLNALFTVLFFLAQGLRYSFVFEENDLR